MDVLMTTSVVTGIADGVLGASLARQAPEGAVPVETGTVPAVETPPRAPRSQRAIGFFGTLNILSGVLLVAGNALFRRHAFSRPVTLPALTRSSDRGNGPSSLAVGTIVGGLAAAGNELRRRAAR
jgi:hypothetical protein